MPDRDDGASLAWFLAGAALGAVGALLLAPQSGQETREQIRRKANESRDAVAARGRDMMDRGRDLYERGREIADEAARSGRQVVERGREIYRRDKSASEAPSADVGEAAEAETA